MENSSERTSAADAITSSNSSDILEQPGKKEYGDEVSLHTEETPSENTLIAWLQVLGAFFCMFNSW